MRRNGYKIRRGRNQRTGKERDFLGATMNKRTFLKICSATMASPFLSRLKTLVVDEQLHNWAGNVEYGTDRVFSAGSVAEVQDFVRKQSKLKVLGTRHCFNH